MFEQPAPGAHTPTASSKVTISRFPYKMENVTFSIITRFNIPGVPAGAVTWVWTIRQPDDVHDEASRRVTRPTLCSNRWEILHSAIENSILWMPVLASKSLFMMSYFPGCFSPVYKSASWWAFLTNFCLDCMFTFATRCNIFIYIVYVDLSRCLVLFNPVHVSRITHLDR